MILSDYLIYLNEQRMGVQPPKPVQKPQPKRGPNQVQSKTPQRPQNPTEPMKKVSPKSYFNYMVWTSNILKQGEIFRRNCYTNNCQQFEIGTEDRRVCKDRCDVETCKKIIGLLRVSMNQCANSKDPEKCKQRYSTLIPLYQQKLIKISNKFVKATKAKKQKDLKVG
jgi:hypothetical protein